MILSKTSISGSAILLIHVGCSSCLNVTRNLELCYLVSYTKENFCITGIRDVCVFLSVGKKYLKKICSWKKKKKQIHWTHYILEVQKYLLLCTK